MRIQIRNSVFETNIIDMFNIVRNEDIANYKA